MRTLQTVIAVAAACCVALVVGVNGQQPVATGPVVRDGLIVMPACTPSPGEQRPWLNPVYSPVCRAKFVVDDLGSLENKLTAVAGLPARAGTTEAGATTANQATRWMTDRGLARLTGSDGPAGIRGASSGVTAFPTPLSVAASFDRSVAQRYGDLLGEEMYAYGYNVVLGPAMDIARVWNFGRVTESFGEDPYLAAEIVGAEVAQLQSHHIATTLKHYAAYNQEQGRLGDHPLRLRPAVDVQVSERALREIYLPSFKAAVQAGPGANVMCSFPRINGTPACEHPHLLGILKNEWQFTGAVAPDFPVAQRTIVAAVNAGLDTGILQSSGTPTPPSNGGADSYFNGEDLRTAVAQGKISPARVDDLLLRRLVPFFAVGAFDHPATRVSDDVSTPQRRAALIDVIASGSVLLKNRGGILPLAAGRSLAIIGAQAGSTPQVVETGSASVTPTHIESVLPAVIARAGANTRVTYAQGTLGLEPLPIAPASLFRTPEGAGGFKVEYFANPNFDYSHPALLSRIDGTVNLNALPTNVDGLPAFRQFTMRWTALFTPIESGPQHFTVHASGSVRVFIGGTLVGAFDNADFSNIVYATVPMDAGKPVEVRVEWTPRTALQAAANDTMGTTMGPFVRLGWSGPNHLLAEAVAAARASDVAVVFVGMKIGEGMDRNSLALQNDQDRLVEAVAAANPRTIVVLQTGGAVTMPWLERVAAVLEMWLPGDSIGPASAKLLFGDLEPGGRLPVTFPADETQGPGREPRQYPGTRNAAGALETAHYDEGIFVGYRYWDQYKQRPLFPFGYGLSYTSFTITNVTASRTPDGGATVRMTATNVGKRAGSEVVQVYVGFPPSAQSAPRQLKAFTKITAQPGEMKSVEIRLARDAFTYWNDAQNGWTTAPGGYTVAIGRSSRDIVGEVMLDAARVARSTTPSRRIARPPQ